MKTTSILTAVASLTMFPTIAGGHMRANIGEREILFGPNYRNELNYFPDEPPAMLNESGLTRFLMTAGTETKLMQGDTPETAVPIGVAFGPSPGFDNGYAGITSIYRDPKKKNIVYGFYHAEDQQGLPVVSYNKKVKIGYWSIGVAKSINDGSSFTKVGQILKSSSNKSHIRIVKDHVGIGDVCVILNAKKDFLYAYYTDLSRRQGNSAAVIAMARCEPAQAIRSASWKKFVDGGFTGRAIGGDETPVVKPVVGFSNEVIQPHVTYIPKWNKYIMVLCAVSGPDISALRPEHGGIFFCHSDDGIKWTEPKVLFHALPIPLEQQEFSAHPALFLDLQNATPTEAKGWLVYAYSPRWGTEAPGIPHHLARRRITFSLSR